MFCKFCNAQVEDNATFCPSCGGDLRAQVNTNAGNFQPQQNYAANNAVPQIGKGLGIASLVTGLIAFFVVPLLFGALAIIFGGVAKSKGYRGGMATAGIVLGIIAVALWLVMMIFVSSLSYSINSMLF